MSGLMKLSLLAGACLAMAACSNNHGAPAPVASGPATSGSATPAASAIPMQAPAAGESAGVPQPSALLTRAPSLQMILERPGFARVFAGMEGASALPAWVKTADQSQPSSRVQVDGQAMWLSHVCEASSCEGGELYLLTDPAGRKMQGLLVTADGTPGATVRQLTWLGKPDAAAQAFLKNRASQG